MKLLQQMKDLRWSGKRRIGSNEEFLRWAMERKGEIRLAIYFRVKDPIDRKMYQLHNTMAKVVLRSPGATFELVGKIHQLLDFLARNGRYPEFT